jgi:hypothetical protein
MREREVSKEVTVGGKEGETNPIALPAIVEFAKSVVGGGGKRERCAVVRGSLSVRKSEEKERKRGRPGFGGANEGRAANFPSPSLFLSSTFLPLPPLARTCYRLPHSL